MASATISSMPPSPRRAALSPGLERLSAGHHQCDHRGSGGLAEQDGGHYCRQRDDGYAVAPTRRHAGYADGNVRGDG